MLVLAPLAAAAPSSVHVELVVSADRAVWQPKGGPLAGTLTLRDVSPRMALLAAAPRRESAVVPAGYLAATWSSLIPRSTRAATKGKRVTNGLLAFGAGGERSLVPVQLELTGSYPDGSRLVFRIRPLTRTGHRTDTLGTRKRTIDDVTLLVDPSITDRLKAFWSALLQAFGDLPTRVPENPTSSGQDGTTIFSAGSSGDPDYRGPARATFSDEPGWVGITRQNWDAAGGSYTSDLSEGLAAGATAVDFRGTQYVGLAIFDHAFSGTIRFDATETSPGTTGRVGNLAVFRVSAGQFAANAFEFGGVDMRGSTLERLDVNGSLFQAIDLTDTTLGSADDPVGRSSVRGSVFRDATANRDNDDSHDGKGATFVATDFTGVEFDGAALRGSTITSTTFQATSFTDVDLSASRITGDSADPGGRFQPTFDGSVFANTKLDGAILENVSFAGVDFSGGLSLDGAILRNVDFSGATGLQFVDWTTVTLDGNVYGLSSVASQLSTELRDHPEYLRSITFDGQVPRIDFVTGFDVQPGTAFLIDPATGVRLQDDGNGRYTPVDPASGARLLDVYGDPLIWSAEAGLTDPLGNRYAVDYGTGRVEGPI